jgi:hypothetical protein
MAGIAFFLPRRREEEATESRKDGKPIVSMRTSLRFAPIFLSTFAVINLMNFEDRCES